MKHVLTLTEAHEHFGQEVTDQEVRNFEAKTQIPIPEFIRTAPVISPTEAYRFAVENFPVPDYPEEYYFLNAIRGLREIRSSGGSVPAAKERLHSPNTGLAEVSSALRGNTFGREEIAAHERERRERRDAQILILEAALIKKYYGIDTPSRTLTEYAAWIAEKTGHPDKSLAYYAHMPGHYNPIFSGLLRSFNPAREWINYFDGSYDIGFHWNLNRSNTDRLDFYSKFVVDSNFPDFHADTQRTKDGLITHTTSINTLDKIWKDLRIGQAGDLIGRVCFSDGRFTASPNNLTMSADGKVSWTSSREVALIFDKRTIQETYAALPMAESFTSHENEYRAYEQIDPRLAIALVPITPRLFSSFQGTAYGKMAVGAIEMEKIIQRYQQTGVLFNRDELETIDEELEKMQGQF